MAGRQIVQRLIRRYAPLMVAFICLFGGVAQAPIASAEGLHFTPPTISYGEDRTCVLNDLRVLGQVYHKTPVWYRDAALTLMTVANETFFPPARMALLAARFGWSIAPWGVAIIEDCWR